MDEGADPNMASDQASDEGGWTPLHHAAWDGDEDLVKLLMDYGADPTQSDNERHTALHNAEGEHCGIIHTLMLNCGPIARHPCANPQN